MDYRRTTLETKCTRQGLVEAECTRHSPVLAVRLALYSAWGDHVGQKVLVRTALSRLSEQCLLSPSPAAALFSDHRNGEALPANEPLDSVGGASGNL